MSLEHVILIDSPARAAPTWTWVRRVLQSSEQRRVTRSVVKKGQEVRRKALYAGSGSAGRRKERGCEDGQMRRGRERVYRTEMELTEVYRE